MMQRRNNQQPSCLVSNWCVYFVSRVVGCCDVNCSPDMGFLICTKLFLTPCLLGCALDVIMFVWTLAAPYHRSMRTCDV